MKLILQIAAGVIVAKGLEVLVSFGLMFAAVYL